MVEKSTVGIIALTFLSALMFVFSYIFYLSGETFVPLVLLFAGLLLAAVLAVKVLFSEKS